MIALLSGKVAQIANHMVTLDVNGVGYELLCSTRCIERLELGSTTKVVVHTDVKQDSIRLYGFDDQLEKHVFQLLTQVQGVGAKSAAEIVSHIDKLELLRAIGAGDEASLQTIKGVGKKTAQRIVVELKDKVGEFAMEQYSSPVGRSDSNAPEEAVEALQALGFNRKDAEKAVAAAQSQADLAAADAGKIVREALRFV